MTPTRNRIDEISRVLLVFGVILLLVANLFPAGRAAHNIFVIVGGCLAVAGIIGTVIGYVIAHRRRDGRRR